MKQIILSMLIIILIPYMIVTFLVRDEEKQEIKNKTEVKVKKDNDEIINIPFEEYIIGVLAGEMPAKFEVEALKAQAVAARSYVLKKMEHNNKDYDVVDTVMNQVYLDNEKLKENYKENHPHGK